MPSFKKNLSALAVAAALSFGLAACGGSGDNDNQANTQAASQPNPNMFFNRVASFPVCAQAGSSCESDVATAAEIVAASGDGMTLIYSNSPKGEIGFIDITDPAQPAGLGALAMGGEPTSVTVLGAHALVAVNTSTDFVNTLHGQPDSVAASKDGNYVAVVIENERDEDLGDGAPPQAPAGSLVIVDSVGIPSSWKTRTVDLVGIAALYPGDPEPEYVDINEDNVAVVTLQENNHIALVDLKGGQVTAHFSAGSVDLAQIDATDERPNRISLTQSLSGRLREPDGVSWISKTQFVTANEGDLNGGSRGFTVFNTDGSVAYDAGNAMEHLMVRIGHANDRRSDAKGNEPENAEFGRFEGTDYLFVASERSSVLAIPGRKLLIAASEEDERGGAVRSVVNVYQYQTAPASYPTLQSADRADGTPIPWGALSGLAAASDTTVYSVEDSFYRASRMFEIDLSPSPSRPRPSTTPISLR